METFLNIQHAAKSNLISSIVSKSIEIYIEVLPSNQMQLKQALLAVLVSVIERASSGLIFSLSPEVASKLIQSESSYSVVAALVNTDAEVFVESGSNERTTRTVYFKALYVASQLMSQPHNWRLFSLLSD